MNNKLVVKVLFFIAFIFSGIIAHAEEEEEPSACLSPFNLSVSSVTETGASLIWFSSDSSEYYNVRYRELGSPTWNLIENVSEKSINIWDLLSCVEYEAQVQTICFNTETSVFTLSVVFETDGCCESPTSISPMVLSESSVFVVWPEADKALSYTVEYKEFTEVNWTQLIVDFNEIQLKELAACKSYLIRVLTICENGTVSEFTPEYAFNTPCGACSDNNYCITGTKNSFSEWIDQVRIGDIDNTSGSNPGGYGDYTGVYSTNLKQDSTYEIYLKPGFNFNYSEWFAAWIDYNQDGEFSPEEEIFNAGMATPDPVSGDVYIPLDSELGWTRMRVGMRYISEPAPCDPQGTFTFGEYEDYCVFIEDDISPCDLGIQLDTAWVTTSSALLEWSFLEDALAYNIRYKKVEEANWNYLAEIDTTIFIEDLDQCEDYIVEVRGVCPTDTSMYTFGIEFSTDCPTSTQEIFTGIEVLNVMPNPFYQNFQISMELEYSMDLNISLYDLQGRKLRTESYFNQSAGAQNYQFNNLSGLAPGMYMVSIDNGKHRLTKKLIKSE